MVGNEQRLDKIEERLINTMATVRHLQQQVVLLTKLEARNLELLNRLLKGLEAKSIELGDPITEMKKRICRKTRRTIIERQVED